MREALSHALVEAARSDPRVVLLTGDHGYSLFDEVRKVCPGQYINAGVAEQNMVGVAAGLAKGGMKPIVYGLSAFVPIRVLEQIKMDICYEELPVVLIGDGAGVVYSALGASHQCFEDLAALRALPNLTILSPCDAAEMAACVILALECGTPVYLRVGKADLGLMHTMVPPVALGQLLPLRSGSGPLAWIATGSMVRTALAAAEHWPGSSVWSVPCIKPIDEELLTEICRSHEVVVLEEHSVTGGLGSTIAEISSSYAPTRVLRIGVQDRFSQYCGSYSYLLREHGLDLASVIHMVEQFLNAAAPGFHVPRRAA